MKTGKVNRIVQLLTTLQSGRKYSIEELMKTLEVSRRTVFRDLKELEEIGVPYYYDNQDGGYTIEPSYFLQPVDLKITEALSLLMLAHKSCDAMDFPLRRSALMAVLKIENNLPVTVRKYCNTALDKISFQKGKIASANKSTTLGSEKTGDFEKIFSLLQKAIHKKIAIDINYKSLYEQKVITTDLSPYHLVYNQRAWYVLGFSSLHKQIRTFKVLRIKSYTKSEKNFKINNKFDIADYFGRAWSMIPEGRLWNVKLRFKPMVAHNVSEVKWHPTQKCQWNSDGSVEMQFRVDGLNEISWWVLSYGDKVKVIKPARLREKLLEMSQDMVRNFQEI